MQLFINDCFAEIILVAHEKYCLLQIVSDFRCLQITLQSIVSVAYLHTHTHAHRYTYIHVCPLESLVKKQRVVTWLFYRRASLLNISDPIPWVSHFSNSFPEQFNHLDVVLVGVASGEYASLSDITKMRQPKSAIAQLLIIPSRQVFVQNFGTFI